MPHEEVKERRLMVSLIARPSPSLSGRLRVPGDKSISHRALILAGLSIGETKISGLLAGADVLCTAAAMQCFGCYVSQEDGGMWSVTGVGVGGLRPPADVIDMGNSGTGVRLLIGLAASHDLTATFTGDESLRARPMGRVTTPLEVMGARFEAAPGERLPMTVVGTAEPLPITYELPVASAQVKSAVMLAGLNTPGTTTVIERRATRDHTERLLRHFGAPVKTNRHEDGGTSISVTGYAELKAASVTVPGDLSSAAFPLVAALIAAGDGVVIEGVGVNPLRTGLVTTLIEMGADIAFNNAREEGGEPVADLHVRSGALKGVDIPPERAPIMIDEYPVLAVAAAFAEGKTVMRGIEELRVKESDRIMATARLLDTAGVAVEELEDGLVIHGTGGRVPGGGRVETFLDHRIAMAALVMGLGAEAPVGIDEDRMIETSFPGFVDLMRDLGGRIDLGNQP